MSLLFRTIQSRFPSFHTGLSAAIQRITNREQKSRHSDWFTNISGNFAARAHAVSTSKGLRVWLTLRRGWHTAEYMYSHIHLSDPKNGIGLPKMHQLACHQAKQLAHLRYRY